MNPTPPIYTEQMKPITPNAMTICLEEWKLDIRAQVALLHRLVSQ